MATSRGKLLDDPRSGARPLAGSPGREETTRPLARTVPRSAPRTAPTPASRPAPQPSGGSASVSAPRSPGRPKGSSSANLPGLPRAPGARGGGGAHNYQAIILAEFVAAELLIAATPIAVRKNQPGLSPYVPRDMTKLVAVGMVYFLLQLAAVGGRSAGRFGAWFGLLILLAVGLNETANITGILDIFDKGNAKPFGSDLGKQIIGGLFPFGKPKNTDVGTDPSQQLA